MPRIIVWGLAGLVLVVALIWFLSPGGPPVEPMVSEPAPAEAPATEPAPAEPAPAEPAPAAGN